MSLSLSSMNTTTFLASISGFRTLLIIRMNTDGAFGKPNGIYRYSYWSTGVTKTVIGWLYSLHIFNLPLFRTKTIGEAYGDSFERIIPSLIIDYGLHFKLLAMRNTLRHIVTQAQANYQLTFFSSRTHLLSFPQFYLHILHQFHVHFKSFASADGTCLLISISTFASVSFVQKYHFIDVVHIVFITRIDCSHT